MSPTPDDAPTNTPSPDRRTLVRALFGAAGAAVLHGCATAERPGDEPAVDDSIRSGAQALTGANLLWFDTVPALRAVNGSTAGQVAIVAGYAASCDGGGGVFVWDPSTTAGHDGGTVLVPLTTPPTGRWRRVFDGALDIRWFGARSDGSDASAAIRAALTAAGTAGGGSVYVPPGVFTVGPTATLPLVVPSHTTLYGDGPVSAVRVANNGPDYLALFAGPPAGAAVGAGFVENVCVRNLRFDLNATGNGAKAPGAQSWFIALLFFNARNLTVEGCQFDGCFGTQTVDLGGDVLRVARCTFRFAPVGASWYDNSAVYLDGRELTVCDNTFVAGDPSGAAAAVTAIEVHRGPALVSGNVIDGNGGPTASRGYQTGINVVSTGAPNPAGPTNATRVTGNTLRNVNYGITLWSLTGYVFRDVAVTDNTITVTQADHDMYSSAGVSFAVDGGSSTILGGYEGVVVADNLISFQLDARAIVGAGSSAGIYCTPGAAVRNLSIRGNVVKNAPARGIVLGRAGGAFVNARVTGNLVLNAGRDAAIAVAGYRCAIALAGAAMVDVLVDDNRVVDEGVGGTTQTLGSRSFFVYPGANSTRVLLSNNRVSAAYGALLYEVDPAVPDGRARALPASAFRVEGSGPAALGDGAWTFAGPATLQAPIELSSGQRLSTATLQYNRGGAGTVTWSICKRAAGVTTVLASVTITSGSGLTTATLSPGYVVESAVEVYTRVQCDHLAHVVERVDLRWDPQ